MKENNIGNIIEYHICKLCKNKFIEVWYEYCKKCAYKNVKSLNYNCKIIQLKFKANNDEASNIVKITKLYTESIILDKSLNQEKSLSLVQYSMKNPNLFNYIWTKSTTFEEFSNSIIYSNQYAYIELILVKYADIRNVDKINGFVEDNRDKITYTKTLVEKSTSSSVVARPILKIYQASFWQNLFSLYFKFYHHQFMAFGVNSFDLETAPDSLLSAIYFAGFYIYLEKLPEIVAYMNTYALTNIRKIITTPRIYNIQALAIYGHTYMCQGNHKLGRFCLANAIRMGQALGISINRKNLSLSDQYNNQILSSLRILNMAWDKYEPTSSSASSEEDDYKELYEPKWQIPSSKLDFFKDDRERTCYTIFWTQYTRMVNTCLDLICKVITIDSNQLELEFDQLRHKLFVVYADANLAFGRLLDQFEDYTFEIYIHRDSVKMVYLIYLLELYTKLISGPSKVKPSLIQEGISASFELSSLSLSSNIMKSIAGMNIYVAAFHLLYYYPKCDSLQQKHILLELENFVELAANDISQYNDVCFLILKSQLDSKKKSFGVV